MTTRQSIRIGRTIVKMDGHLVETTLYDGGVVYAIPHDTEGYREKAERLGYGDDIGRMCRDHELVHVLLAEALGLRESPVMRKLASGQPDSAVLGYEEDAVLAIQRFATAAGVNVVAALSGRAYRPAQQGDDTVIPDAA